MRNWQGKMKTSVRKTKNYKLLRKAFGSKQMDSLLGQAKAVQQSKQRGKRFRNNQEER